ncbi:hypothetical protein ADK86_36840 [Streptomyces sp. NRRL F-5755]|nr:hypothetical protein ADK86_36840 [Streptomyces sp. NRRL F-5755]
MLSEDRADFSQLLDEALRITRPRLGTVSAAEARLNTEQLRTMALSASTAIAACATAEYQHYVRLRHELHNPAPAWGADDRQGQVGRGTPADDSHEYHHAVRVSDERVHEARYDTSLQAPTSPPEEERQLKRPSMRLTPRQTPASSSKTGSIATTARRTPLLAGILTLFFLLIGVVLRAVDVAPSVARAAISTGWAFAAFTTVGVIAAMARLLRTARHNGSLLRRGPSFAEDLNYLQASETRQRAVEVALARDAWQKALMEHGILPFLRRALADPADTDIRDPSRCVPRRGSVSYVRSRDHSQPDSTNQADGPPATSQPRLTQIDYGDADEE